MGHFSPFRWFERGEFSTNGRLNILLALIHVFLYHLNPFNLVLEARFEKKIEKR